ncbi:MAG: hypothetical protein Q8O67_11050 [Deltaproteobacteria bacterium]|nr:hypothetical protein [Deltaproteobacteria bacterium]
MVDSDFNRGLTPPAAILRVDSKIEEQLDRIDTAVPCREDERLMKDL